MQIKSIFPYTEITRNLDVAVFFFSELCFFLKTSKNTRMENTIIHGLCYCKRVVPRVDSMRLDLKRFVICEMGICSVSAQIFMRSFDFAFFMENRN